MTSIIWNDSASMASASMFSAFLILGGNKIIENLGSMCMLGMYKGEKENWLIKTILHYKSEEWLPQNSGLLKAINLSALATYLNCS